MKTFEDKSIGIPILRDVKFVHYTEKVISSGSLDGSLYECDQRVSNDCQCCSHMSF